MNLIERDKKSIWHPYTQHQTISDPVTIVSGKGAYIVDENGHKYLDLISSWWVNLHGHAHPDIAKAIYEQAMTIEHVIFSSFTHEPAVKLAEELLALLPKNMSKIFYSDNGSTSVEVAIKMAYQYWHNKNQQRKRFIAFENGYHGDTVGAMSVGKNAFNFSLFSELLFTVNTISFPSTWLGDHAVEEKEHHALKQLKQFLNVHGDEVAAMIIEPLVQGCAGMQMCRPQFLQQVEKLLREYEILIIYDEVLTGFGRTGDFFACNKANTQPDIVCFAKGLTGGFLPLGATACNEKIYDGFLGDNFSKALAHGHSYTANPLGCRAALASLKLLKSDETQSRITAIEKIHQAALNDMPNSFAKPRYCGTIAAFDINLPVEYGSPISVKIRDSFVKKGLLIRPLGKTIYLIPPYCVTNSELTHAYEIMINEIEGVLA